MFANGIVWLALASGGLIVLFNGDTHALIPLFAIGAFLAFTLSQTGMVIHWWRERGRRWQAKSVINGLGAIMTAITVVVVAISKFLDGAWITIVLIPIGVVVLYRVHGHYRVVGKQLSLRGLPPSLKPFPPPRIVIPIWACIAASWTRSILRGRSRTR